MEAIILAGGLGTRLQSVLPDIPKCMAMVGGKPFISYVIDHFKDQGIKNFIFSLGYKHEVIEDFLQGYPSLQYQVSIEDGPLGTGGAIKLACKHVSGKTALVINGDTLFRIRLNKIVPFHEMCASVCTLVLKPMSNFSRYGVVELNTDYSIKNFREKQYYESGYINGGAYILHVVKFLEETFPDKFSFEKDYLEAMYTQRRMYGVIQDEYFIDIGIPEDYEKANYELREL